MQDIFNVKGVRFNGFADFWWQENYSLKSQFTFITEPKIWYNVGQFFNCPNLNIGGEVEISYNFTGNNLPDKFYVNPCFGVKWDF